MTQSSQAAEAVSTEVARVARRWHELPAGHAASAAPRVREVAQWAADEAAEAAGCARRSLPQLGEATDLHQLQVVVHDLLELDDDQLTAALADRLTALRRSLP